VAVVLVTSSLTAPDGTDPTVAGPTVAGPTGTAAAWPGWGFTHTEFSADTGSAQATRSVEQAVSADPLVQAQSIMGWGTDNPEPSPGVYDWASLDRRMDLIRRSGGVPVITLCCAPDWMKGGQAGKTDWSRLEVAPDPAHFADFAALAAEVVNRYPDVHHYLVWNEFKGFWDAAGNHWDAEGYTDFYNAVYDAVKDVDPNAQVGGPYLPMVGIDPTQLGDTAQSDPASLLQGPWGAIDPRVLDAFRYWFQHARGGDFIVVDGHANASDGVDPFEAVQKFSAVNDWIRRSVDQPIWWAEYYLDPAVDDWPADEQLAVQTAAMIEFAASGTETALYWNPRPTGPSCATCLWTDTTAPGGGQPLPFLTDVLQQFARWFPPGTALEKVTVPDGVEALAQPEAAVLVNTTSSTVQATVLGTDVTLAPHAVRWVLPG
jgi:hypothetical protein